MNQYFYNTNVASPNLDFIFDAINKNKITFQKTDLNIQIEPHPPIPQDLIQLDPFLKYINQKVEGKGALNVFKFPSMTHYQWHIDRFAKYNFNYVFDSYNSNSLFKATEEDSNMKDVHKVNFNVIEVPYTPKKWLLFNAQIQHCVNNLDTKNRFVLSYSVWKGCQISYKEMIEIVKSYN